MENKYSSIRILLDNNANRVLENLPRNFSVNMFADIVHQIMPIEYAQCVTRLTINGFKNWIASYYLPRKSYVKRYEILIGDRMRIKDTSKQRFDRLWVKK